MNRLIISVSLLVLFNVFVSCEAPHSNPLDPSNPDYKYGSIAGKVISKTGEDLKDVTVTWKKTNIIATTDTSGEYKIDDIERVNGTVYFSKEGFKDSLLTVNWGSQKNKTNVNMSLAYRIGQLDGTVNSLKGEPLAGVKVTWVNQNIFTITDSQGHFIISDVIRDPGTVTFEKEGYSETKFDVKSNNWGINQNFNLGIITMGYTIGVIDGTVFSYPRIPVEGARVIWKNQNIVTYTNSLGNFKLKDIKTETGKLEFEKTGLKSDTIDVVWNDRDSLQFIRTLKYSIGSVSGRTYSFPGNIAEGVKVTWENLNISTLSKSDGSYKISNLPMIEGKLTFEKEGLKPTFVTVQWDDLKDSIPVNDVTLNYSTGKLSGFVNEYITGNVLSSVQVLWKNTNQITYTNSNGKFSFSNVPYDNGQLYFQKDGYYKDSANVIFNTSGNEQQLDSPIQLKFIPTIDSINIATTVQFDFNNTTYSMYVFALINDPSQQIRFNQVFVKCTALNLNQKLVHQSGYYDYTVLFGQKNIGAGLGEDFIITGINSNNKEFVIGKTKLTRVIDKEITVRSPINGEIVSSQPTLKWDRFLPGFNFHYSIRIYDESNPSSPAWQNENVSSDAISVTPEFQLSSPRKYYWYITCIDQYGNASTSKRYSFEVQ